MKTYLKDKYFEFITWAMGAFFIALSSAPVQQALALDSNETRKNTSKGMKALSDILNVVIGLDIAVGLLCALAGGMILAQRTGRAFQSGNSGRMVEQMQDLGKIFLNTVILAASTGFIAVLVKMFFGGGIYGFKIG